MLTANILPKVVHAKLIVGVHLYIRDYEKMIFINGTLSVGLSHVTMASTYQLLDMEMTLGTKKLIG